MRWRTSLLSLPLAVVALAGATPGSAHHSFSMFDRGRTQALSGTIKSFDMINPHSWLEIVAPAASGGGMTEWSLEMGGTGQINRRGWTQATFKPGDKITVTYFPLRDGSNGGQFLNVTQLNGKPFGA